MQDKVFIDTNILLYSYSKNEPIKQQKSLEVINENIDFSIISKQVINEISNIFFRKFALNATQIKQNINDIYQAISVVDFDKEIQFLAIEIKQKHQIQFYDALIIATAIQNNCNILYSEDMQHSQTIDRLKIINPFV
jgi:predicted nucleic acid-binding protein